jgi:hypothetical protein
MKIIILAAAAMFASTFGAAADNPESAAAGLATAALGERNGLAMANSRTITAEERSPEEPVNRPRIPGLCVDDCGNDLDLSLN